MPVGYIECSPEPVLGIRLAAAAGGIRYSGRDDIALIECSVNTTAASIFTKNQFKAAPVLLAQANLEKATPRYLLINSGNANAATGDMGFADAVASTEIVAEHAQVRPEEVPRLCDGGEPDTRKRAEATLQVRSEWQGVLTRVRGVRRIHVQF